MKKFALLLLLSVVFLYLNITPLVRMLRGYTSFILNPISYTFVTADSEIGDFFYTLRTINGVKQENKLLKDSLQKTQALVVMKDSRDVLNNFEQTQREFLNQKGSLVSGEVVGTYQDSGEQYLEINKGLESGISTGDTVAYNGYLVGNITSAFPNKSTIKVAKYSKSEIPAKTSNSSATGLFVCLDGTNCLFDKIITSEVLNTGDLVVTSGIGGLYVSDLILGEVTNVNTSPEKLFKSANLVSILDINRINKVTIIVNE